MRFHKGIFPPCLIELNKLVRFLRFEELRWLRIQKCADAGPLIRKLKTWYRIRTWIFAWDCQLCQIKSLKNLIFGCKGMLLYTYLNFYRLRIFHVNLSYTNVRHWIALTFDRTRIPASNYSDYQTVKSMPFIFLRTVVPPVYLTFAATEQGKGRGHSRHSFIYFIFSLRDIQYSIHPRVELRLLGIILSWK
jgi:hypothetical protein